MYPAEIVNPMKAELVEAGFSELLDSAAVDAALAEEGTSVVVLNSVCGCAAGSMRPGVKASLENAKLPSKLLTAFAGFDVEAVERVRKHTLPYPTEQPSGCPLQRRQAGPHGGAPSHRRPHRRDARRAPQGRLRRVLLIGRPHPNNKKPGLQRTGFFLPGSQQAFSPRPSESC